MLEMNRRPAVDDRAQRRDPDRRISLEQPHDHCGREEGQDSHALVCDETQNAVGIEAAARVDDVLRAARQRWNQIHPASVRQGRRVQEPVVRPKRANVREAIDRHGDQIAMAEHRALRTTGRARGIEQPGRVVGRALRRRRRLRGPREKRRLQRVLRGGVAGDDRRQAGVRGGRCEIRRDVRIDDDGLGFGVVDDIGGFAGMELGVDGDGDKSAAERA